MKRLPLSDIPNVEGFRFIGITKDEKRIVCYVKQNEAGQHEARDESDAQSVADAERQNYPRFEVRTDAADKIGDHIEGYGEKLVSVHSTEDEAEKALPKAQKAAWHGHNRAQVWKVVNEGTALGGAQITW